MVQGIGDGIAELAVWQNLRRDVIEPFLENIEDGNAVLLAKAANAIGLGFAVVRRFFLRLPFDPVELLEELERLLRRTATFLS